MRRPPARSLARGAAPAGRGDLHRRVQAPLAVGRLDSPRRRRRPRSRAPTPPAAPRRCRCSPTGRSSAAASTICAPRARRGAADPAQGLHRRSLPVLEARAAGADAVLLIVERARRRGARARSWPPRARSASRRWSRRTTPPRSARARRRRAASSASTTATCARSRRSRAGARACARGAPATGARRREGHPRRRRRRAAARRRRRRHAGRRDADARARSRARRSRRCWSSRRDARRSGQDLRRDLARRRRAGRRRRRRRHRLQLLAGVEALRRPADGARRSSPPSRPGCSRSASSSTRPTRRSRRVATLGLDRVQLHGDETPGDYRHLDPARG